MIRNKRCGCRVRPTRYAPPPSYNPQCQYLHLPPPAVKKCTFLAASIAQVSSAGCGFSAGHIHRWSAVWEHSECQCPWLLARQRNLMTDTAWSMFLHRRRMLNASVPSVGCSVLNDVPSDDSLSYTQSQTAERNILWKVTFCLRFSVDFADVYIETASQNSYCDNTVPDTVTFVWRWTKTEIFP